MATKSYLKLRLNQNIPHAFTKPPPCSKHRTSRHQSTIANTPDDIAAILAKPSWSVKALLKPNENSIQEPITQKQLHHLLRLSALPRPKSDVEEARMISDLQSQLHFVQAIQRVDTEGVEPLQSIRDETKDAERENTVTVESLQDELSKEVVVGRRGRIKRSKDPRVDRRDVEDWDPLAHAPQKRGRYFVVNTNED